LNQHNKTVSVTVAVLSSVGYEQESTRIMLHRTAMDGIKPHNHNSICKQCSPDYYCIIKKVTVQYFNQAG